VAVHRIEHRRAFDPVSEALADRQNSLAAKNGRENRG
jgi:hypothetical protein